MARLARRFERAIRRRFDAIVTISDAMAARLMRQVHPTPVAVLRNWVDTRRPRDGRDPAAIRQAFGVPPACRLVLYAGNLGAKQGLSVVIDAARHLRADPSIRFLVVGDGVMAAPMRAAAASLPNLGFTGLLPPEAIGGLLGAADLHLLPQDRAASDLVFPSKLGPLLMTGKPIVVTADAGSELAAWLGQAALRSPPGDSRALAAAIVAGLRHAPAADPAHIAGLFAALDAGMVLPAFERCLVAPAPGRAEAPAFTEPRRTESLPTALA